MIIPWCFTQLVYRPEFRRCSELKRDVHRADARSHGVSPRASRRIRYAGIDGGIAVPGLFCVAMRRVK